VTDSEIVWVENAVGRKVPTQWGEKRFRPYQGPFVPPPPDARKASPAVRKIASPEMKNKVLHSIKEAIERVGLRDGMTISFHHHFRDGDMVMNMVLETVRKMGIKNLTLAPTSTFPCQADMIIKCIQDRTITHIEGGSLRGKLGEYVSKKAPLKEPVHIRSHGGRVRAVMMGDFHIDVAFIGAPTCDPAGNCNGVYGPSACGCIQFSAVDAHYADQVVAITDNLVEYPATPMEITEEYVDYVVVVDRIGDPEKIVSGTTKITRSPTRLKIARDAVTLTDICGYIREGMGFQTGAGGISLAYTKYLGEILKERNITAGFAMGGTTGLIVDLLKNGHVKKLLTGQAFDLAAVQSIPASKHHKIISPSHYANIYMKGNVVNHLDVIVLGATEVDVNFNVNTVTFSNGVLAEPIGGHQDTAAGAKLTIITVPLLRGRMPMVLDRVTTVTTPGETVDAVVTEYGVAINPRRQDLIDAIKQNGTGGLNIVPIEKLRDMAYRMAGITRQKEPKWGDRVVAMVEYRDGSIIDVVKNITQ